MLKLIEVLLGVVVVMLVVSPVVTAVTEVINRLVNNRGAFLAGGLRRLLRQIDPELGWWAAFRIACAVLRHPMVKGNFLYKGDSISREEFALILLEIGGSCVHNVEDKLVGKTDVGVGCAVRAFLERNGVIDPAETQKKVHDLSAQLELRNPKLPVAARQNIALSEAGAGALVGNISAWFERMIVVASQQFSRRSRVIAFIAALLVAVTMPLDVFDLIGKLTREGLPNEILKNIATQGGEGQGHQVMMIASSGREDKRANIELEKRVDLETGHPAGVAPTLPENTSAETMGSDKIKEWLCEVDRPGGQSPAKEIEAPRTWSDGEKKALRSLIDRGAITIPQCWGTGWAGITLESLGRLFLMLSRPGIWISAILLSFGAPFWYDLFKFFSRFRGGLGGKAALYQLISNAR